MNDNSNFQSLVELLQARAASDQRIDFIAGQDDYQTCTYAHLFERATKRLGLFQQQGIEPGDHMIIQSMLDNVALYTDKANMQRVVQFAEDNPQESDLSLFENRCCLIDDNADDASANDSASSTPVHVASPQSDDVAFIQFSSGSTSAPKGIVLTHRNLLINTQSIIDGCQMTTQDHLLSWMPLTHDMGLIGFHLTPLLRDTSHALIPTEVFVRRPALWLSEAQRLGSSILCSPNFGFQHVLKSFKADKHPTLDLSCVRLMFNGAEPISVPLCEQFMQTMAPFHLAGDAMYPVYGLAEASLAVTFPSLEQRFLSLKVERASLTPGQRIRIVSQGDEQDGARFVSVGQAVSNVEVSICDEQNEPLSEHVSGRICIRGPNVTSGYYKQPDLNALLIDSQGWLDTGDLGFIHQSNLYITGRGKDIIFINGQNVYPHDLEELLFKQDVVERGKLAIASQAVDATGEEQLLVFVLHRTDIADLEEQARTITRTLGSQAGVSVSAVIATPRIPKTTSGKVQRFQLVKDYKEHGFSAIFPRTEDDSTEALEALESPVVAEQIDTLTASAEMTIEKTTAVRLLAICNAQVENMSVAADDNLFDLGISSLTLAEIHAAIEDTWPGQVEVTDLFDYPTVTELAAFLDSKAE